MEIVTPFEGLLFPPSSPQTQRRQGRSRHCFMHEQFFFFSPCLPSHGQASQALGRASTATKKLPRYTRSLRLPHATVSFALFLETSVSTIPYFRARDTQLRTQGVLPKAKKILRRLISPSRVTWCHGKIEKTTNTTFPS